MRPERDALMKLYMQIFSFLLLIILLGCDNAPKQKKEIYLSNTEAEKQFSSFIEEHSPALERALIKHKLNLITSGLKGEEPKTIDWYVSKEKKEKLQSGFASAHVSIAAERTLNGAQIPMMIFLWFERIDGKWHLIIENGYLSSLTQKNKSEIPPALHEDIKKIFPYTMELNEWARNNQSANPPLQR
jgi:uncharacterized lipoprotein NlpE involved in copper resistance